MMQGLLDMQDTKKLIKLFSYCVHTKFGLPEGLREQGVGQNGQGHGEEVMSGL